MHTYTYTRTARADDAHPPHCAQRLVEKKRWMLPARPDVHAAVVCAGHGEEGRAGRAAVGRSIPVPGRSHHDWAGHRQRKRAADAARCGADGGGACTACRLQMMRSAVQTMGAHAQHGHAVRCMAECERVRSMHACICAHAGAGAQMFVLCNCVQTTD
eukprot:356841-Chlamydomonas_euryale.AAC.2